MAQVRLNRPRVGGPVGQVIATGVSQLMWMHRKRDLRQLPSPLDDVPHYGVRKRGAALGRLARQLALAHHVERLVEVL